MRKRIAYYLLGFLLCAGMGFLAVLMAIKMRSDSEGTADVTVWDEGGLHFDSPDSHPQARNYSELVHEMDALGGISKKYRIGVVLKFFGNQYWQFLAEGIRDGAREYDLYLNIQAGSSELSPEAQLERLMDLLDHGCDGLIVSPQTKDNLAEGLEAAYSRGIPVVNINEVGDVGYAFFVGARQLEAGRIAAQYLMRQLPDGGQLAIVKGLSDVYAAEQRTRGFLETLDDSLYEVVEVVDGAWDLQVSLDVATLLLMQYPDLRGFYCNNDNMALGVAQAVRRAQKTDDIIVVGTDGIGPAYDAIRDGSLSATVDSFPYHTGKIALEVMLRILEGQDVPPVIFSPQELITKDNANLYTNPKKQ
ncbi:MAG: substrate-binding domain-containing protein [Candidatus Sumerlaeia bacterium]